jgi:hypothetical protein
MRRAERMHQVLELAGRGLGASDVARITGLPRSTIRDWMRAGPVRQCGDCGGREHDFAALPAEYAYLLGVYLGDGCISAHPRGVYRLRLFLDTRYPGIVAECAAAMRVVCPGNKVTLHSRSGGFANSAERSNVEVSAYWRGWPCLFPQHGPGRKHERPIVLADWQRELVQRHPGLLLRGLIHSDGCRFINTGTNWRHPRYSFSNVSADIRRIFCDACELLGLHWTEAPRTVYVSRKRDVARLDEFIGPKD